MNTQNAVATVSTVADHTPSFLTQAVATFEGVERLANLMAKCGTMPAHLQGKPADCFRIVVQAAKWRMDPFAVAECTSLVHGRMCFEGKLVAAVLQSLGAIEGRLTYDITGKGQDASITVTGTPRGGTPCSLTGTVAFWRTTLKKDGQKIPNAWDSQPETMLVYRGTRQWARLYAPEALLGVYTPDELEETPPIRDAQATVIPDAQPGQSRTLPPGAVEATTDKPAEGATSSAPASGEGTAQEPAQKEAEGPTLQTVMDLANKLHADFKSDGIKELKGISKKLGIAKLAECPPAQFAEAITLINLGRKALQAGA